MSAKKKCRELYEQMDSAIAHFVIAIRAVLPDNRNAVMFEGTDWKSFRHNSTHKKAVPDAVDDLLGSGTLRRLTIKTGGRNKVVNRLMEE